MRKTATTYHLPTGLTWIGYRRPSALDEESIHKGDSPGGFAGNAFGGDEFEVVETLADEPKSPTSPTSLKAEDADSTPRRQFSLSQADAKKKLKRLERALSQESDTDGQDDNDSICDVPDSPRDPLVNSRDITTPLGSYIHCVLGKSSPINTQFLTEIDSDVIGDGNGDVTLKGREKALHLQTTGLEVQNESLPVSPRSDVLNASWNLSNASDLSNSMQLKEQLRENKLQLDRETSLRSGAEKKMKSLDTEKKEHVHKISGLNKLKSNLEQKVVDLEAKIRSLEYNLSEESEKRKSAELLHRKTKEQLERKEAKYNEDRENGQKRELNVRNLMMEVKSLKSKVMQLEDDRENLSHQLEHERSTRTLQEQMHQDQVKIQYASLQQASSASPDIDISSMEPAEGAKLVRETCDKLKTELYAAQMELERVKSHQREDHLLMVAETERLQKHVDDLKDELTLNQEALTQATMQHNTLINSLKTENSVLQSSAEKEKSAHDKTETEHESLKNRWQFTSEELTKTQAARAELDRSLHREQEALVRQKERSDLEIGALRDANHSLTQRAHDAETRSKALESDLTSLNSSLMEKMNVLANLQREHGQMQMSLDNTENALNKDKEERVKLSAKVEALQERNHTLAAENQSYKQRLDVHQRESSDKDRAVLEAQNRFTDLLQSVRSDYDKSRSTLEEKNNSLQEIISSLKDQLRDSELRLRSMEKELKCLQQENDDLRRKLTTAEFTSSNVSKHEMEDFVHKLEVDNARLESSLKHETERVENLRRDLKDANKARASLEEENRTLRSVNDRLDERVAEETVNRTVHAEDAQESRDLWQSEMKSASKLGRKLAQLEREKAEMTSILEEEKTRVRSATERERLVESKLENIQEKNLELEKELAGMKAKLKMAKKTGALVENGDMLTDTVSGLRQQVPCNQLTDVQQQLQLETSRSGGQQHRVQQLQQDQNSLKAREKALLKAEKAKKKIEESYRQYQEDLSNLRANYQELLVQKTNQDGEVQKLKTKFDSEHRIRETLEDRLYQTTSPPKLTTDMLHRSTSTPHVSPSQNGYLTPTQTLSNQDLTQRIRNELNRSIAKHLETPSRKELNVPIRTSPDDAGESYLKSSNDYRSILHKNYLL